MLLIARRPWLAVFLSILVLAPMAAAQTAPGRLANPKEIHQMLVQRVDVEHKSYGIVVGVITKKGREIIAYGQFDKDDPRPVDGDSVFEIGSVSKTFTALLLEDMVLKGEVKLNDPVQKYLPDAVHMPTRNGKQITLLELATHYSGLPNDGTNFHWNYSVAEMYDFLNQYQLTRDPGTKFEYSNMAVGLLGQVLAARAGTDYETLLRTRITGPLGMDNTAIQPTAAMQANLVPGHGGNLAKAQVWAMPAYDGASSIRSTANDMLIYLAANAGIIHTPLQSAAKKMLSVRRPQAPGVEIALGWNIRTAGEAIAFHNGKTLGFYTFAGFDPKRKIGVVVLSGSDAEIADIGWRIFHYQVQGPVEQQIGPPNLPR